MKSTIQRVRQAVATGALCACTQMFAVDAQAADSQVPADWNVAPFLNGAYRESFDSELPTWADLTTGASVVTNVFPEITGLPVRSNAWFGANVKVLQLDTDGTVLTNSVISGESPVSFATNSVYVDMRVKFDAMTDEPDATLLNDAKLAVFVSSDCKLVAVHANGWATNSVVLLTNNWHQLTIKLTNTTYDVLLDDVPVFSHLTLKDVGTAKQMAAASFCGTGLIDDLYISHGDPAYAVTGPTTTIPDLPVAGDHPPSDVQQTRINVWLSAHPSVTNLVTLSQDQLSQAYLLNEVGVLTDGAPAPVAYAFGISAFDLVSPTNVVVTANLLVNGSAKAGEINGKIQLQGKVHNEDISWTLLLGAITPSYADFTAGKATYTFTVPSGGYRFFQPLIVP